MAYVLHAACNSKTQPQKLRLTSYWRPALGCTPVSVTRSQMLHAHVHTYSCFVHAPLQRGLSFKRLYGCHELLWLICLCVMKAVLMNLVFTTNGPNQSCFFDVPLPSHKQFHTLMFMDDAVVETWWEASSLIVLNRLLVNLNFVSSVVENVYPLCEANLLGLPASSQGVQFDTQIHYIISRLAIFSAVWEYLTWMFQEWGGLLPLLSRPGFPRGFRQEKVTE